MQRSNVVWGHTVERAIKRLQQSNTTMENAKQHVETTNEELERGSPWDGSDDVEHPEKYPTHTLNRTQCTE